MINMVFTNVGRNLIRDWLSGGGYSYAYPISITMGSGTIIATVSDTALGGEIGSATNAGSIYRINPFSSISLAPNEIQYEGVFPSIVGSQTTFSEVGIFNTSGANTGSLFARTTFVATSKTINEEWSMLYTLRLS